jgi:hypothetical protein
VLADLEALVHQRLARQDFVGVVLSPLCPLGTVSALATVDQNNVVSTVRSTETVADVTNVLALECAMRRRDALRADPRSRQRIRLAATHRVVRAQAFAGKDMAAHFALLGLCTAGRDEGSFDFETTALAEQINVHLDILESARALGHHAGAVRVFVTDLTGGLHREALREGVLDRLQAAHPEVTFAFDDDRLSGRAYYSSACFEIRATTPAGADLNLSDGGFTTWTSDLLSNSKERLLTSGLGLDRLSE